MKSPNKKNEDLLRGYLRRGEIESSASREDVKPDERPKTIKKPRGRPRKHPPENYGLSADKMRYTFNADREQIEILKRIKAFDPDFSIGKFIHDAIAHELKRYEQG